MNRRIVLSAMSIVGALAVMGGATFAAFSDSVTATDNTFATATADLKIAPDASGVPDAFVDSIPGPNFTGILPGQTKSFLFWLRNNTTDTLNLDVTADVASIVGDDADQDLDNALLVRWTCDMDGNNSLGNDTPSGEFSPRDWLNGGNASILLNLPSGTNRVCQMDGRLPSTADNTVAGETLKFNVSYDATQVAP